MKTKKILKITLSIVVLFLLIGIASILLINFHVKSSVKEQILNENDVHNIDIDCILILGAGVWSGGRPSPMLEDRLLQGIELYKKDVSNRILMSGDHGRKDYDEVNVMKQFAIEHGVPSEHIFMDHAGFSTYDSIYRAKHIFEAGKIVIVTQQYHLYRALYIADKLGIESVGVPSDPRLYAGQSARNQREVLARTKDFFYTVLKPKPTHLGETIPVSGDGNLTND